MCRRLGVIRYSRGQIVVLDRKKLEQLSCECYAVVKKESDRLLAPREGASRAPGKRVGLAPHRARRLPNKISRESGLANRRARGSSPPCNA
mgnify:CR=1 FL=1